MPFWTCVKCGNRKIGVTKPRRNATIRFCLPCSEKSTRLVDRLCLTLEAATARRHEARKEKTKKARERANAREVERYTLNGVNLLAELQRLWSLPAAKTRRLEHGREDTLPKLRVIRSADATHWRGMAYGLPKHSITIRAGVLVDQAMLLEILAHEIAHLCAPAHSHHGAAFTQTLNEIAREAWPNIATLPLHNANKYVRSDILYRAIKLAIKGTT